jgi:hypothetical protein
MSLHIQKKTGLRIIYLFGLPWQRFDRRIKHRFDVGPLEFLTWIKNASLVLTTSFHATVFSASFKRPFYSIYPDGETGSRQLSILKCLQLESRGLQVGEEFPEAEFYKIDYDNVCQRLEKMREDSYDYLKRMLAVCD